jgi:hypothetical protein
MEIWRQAERRFWQLFFGPLVIVEDDNVARAMMLFGAEMSEVGEEPDLPVHRLQGPSLSLSGELRKLLIKSWKIEDLKLVLESREA